MKGEQVNFLMAGLKDSTGAVLNAGKVYTWEAGAESSHKHLYTDIDCTTPATDNPLVLDSRGTCGTNPIFARGSYRFVVKTSADVTVNTWDYLYFGNKISTLWGGTTGGNLNAYTITCSPTTWELSSGQRYGFIVHATNGAGATLNADALGAYTLKTNRGGTLYDVVAGEIPTGTRIEVIFDGSSYVITNRFSPDGTWVPEVTANGTITVGAPTNTFARYWIENGNVVHFKLAGHVVLSGTLDADILYISIPVATSLDNQIVYGNLYATGPDMAPGAAQISSSTDKIAMQLYGGGLFAATDYYYRAGGYYYLA